MEVVGLIVSLVNTQAAGEIGIASCAVSFKLVLCIKAWIRPIYFMSLDTCKMMQKTFSKADFNEV